MRTARDDVNRRTDEHRLVRWQPNVRAGAATATEQFTDCFITSETDYNQQVDLLTT